MLIERNTKDQITITVSSSLDSFGLQDLLIILSTSKRHQKPRQSNLMLINLQMK